MEFDNSFEVPLPPAEAWAVLMDIPRIAPCLPGAELTDVVDDTIDVAHERIVEYSLPLEDARAYAAYGQNSRVGKILEIHQEAGGAVGAALAEVFLEHRWVRGGQAAVP